ncbi:Inner membrane protein ygbE [Leclercia adecarboxylata]|uniref:Inner membrane protein ygbE n=1 Tax=Leclercia adecarboxylata TaxID=83655 RepID=A0A4U9IIX4_9ENTR|nr:Inner membrane protein ygbE [Leclercia adecarboxylata]
MRNSENYIITGSDRVSTNDETTWSFPGAIVGFRVMADGTGHPVPVLRQ